MSYIQLRCFITPPGHPEGEPPELQNVAEFRNSHGWGPMIWTSLCERYHHNGMAWLMEPQKLSLDALPKMTGWERTTLLTTFDLSLVRAEDVKLWAEHLLAFSAKHNNPRNVNHLPEVAECALKALEERPGIVAFCVYASVGDDLWRIYEPELEENRDYDLTKDTGHFYVDFASPPKVPEVTSEEV